MCNSHCRSCLLEVLNFGMRNGGGIGDTLHVYNAYTQTFQWVGHSFFDWLFFIIINGAYCLFSFGPRNRDVFCCPFFSHHIAVVQSFS